MVRYIRKGKARHGLVLANGGVATYQHAVCLSSKPRENGSTYPNHNSLPELVSDFAIPPIDEKAEGSGVIEVSRTRS